LTTLDTDPYTILGIRKDADLEEVKSAYRRLVRLWHPDVCGRSMENIKRFLTVKDAYLLLKKRLQAQATKRASSISHSTAANAVDRESSVEGTFLFVQIGLQEALYGTHVTIEIADGQDFCRKCSGLGQIAAKNPSTCPACKGKGYKTLSWGEQDLKIICAKCSGRGKEKLTSCPNCSGRGIITRKKKVEVQIPPGTRNGTVLQIETHRTSSSNDSHDEEGYFLEVEVEMPEGWIIHGNDIISTIDIDCWTKLGGGYIEIDTVDGPEKVFVTPGLGNERFIKIPNKGWINKDGKRGNHLVRLNVLSPKGPCPKDALILINQLKVLWPCEGYSLPALPAPDLHTKHYK